MKDWRDKRMIDYLEGLNAELPQSDWEDFLSRKAAHDLAAKRRRGFLTAAISIPAAAAVLLLLFLQPINRTPAGQMAQNNPQPPQEEQLATIDSISNPADNVKLGGILAEPVLVQKKTNEDSIRIAAIIDEKLKGKVAGAIVKQKKINRKLWCYRRYSTFRIQSKFRWIWRVWRFWRIKIIERDYAT